MPVVTPPSLQRPTTMATSEVQDAPASQSPAIETPRAVAQVQIQEVPVTSTPRVVLQTPTIAAPITPAPQMLMQQISAPIAPQFPELRPNAKTPCLQCPPPPGVFGLILCCRPPPGFKPILRQALQFSPEMSSQSLASIPTSIVAASQDPSQQANFPSFLQFPTFASMSAGPQMPSGQFPMNPASQATIQRPPAPETSAFFHQPAPIAVSPIVSH